jgi:hypothetical protein
MHESLAVPLIYRDVGLSQSGTIWDAMSGDIRVAQVRKNILSVTAGKAVTWSWTIYFTRSQDGLPGHGVVSSLEEAKVQIDRAWQTWLDASGLGDWERQYKELCQGVRLIRQALEETHGAGILPVTTAVETPLQDCELIAKAIHSLKVKP